MTGSNSFWLANPSTGFYNGDVEQSIRMFGTTGYLSRQFVTPTSQRKMIFSVWVKPSEFGDKQHIMGGGSGGTNYLLFSFSASGFYNATDSFKLGVVSGNSTQLYLVTDRLFRDPSAWMHVCVAIDTTQATASNRLQLFFNGKRYTGGYATSTYPSENLDIPILNSAMYHHIGLLYAGANYGHFNGYLADFYFLDGQSIYSDTSATINSTFLADADTLGVFCEQKNGVAIPKAYTSGNYGNNGFRLEFKNSTAGGESPSSSTLGADTSGENHHFNDYSSAEMQGNIPDSPENNFCTLNPLAATSSFTATEGALRWTSSSYSYQGTTATIGMPTSGKWYFECYIVTAGAATSHDFGIGVVSIDDDGSDGDSANNNVHNNGAFYVTRRDSGSRIMVDGSAVFLNDTASVTAGQFMQCAFDADSGKIWFGRNNSWWDSSVTAYSAANGPAAGNNNPGTIDSGHQYIIMFNGYSNTYVTVANFGQDSSFGGEVTRQNNSDGNGQGDFYYSPPTGFLAICTANLPDPTIGPQTSTQADDHFNTVTYTGANNTTQSITDVGFKPDWLWVKARSVASDHYLFDSTRNADAIASLSTNDTGSEDSTSGQFTQFTATGFDLPADNAGYINYNARTYVAWNWKANGGTTTTNDASSTSIGTIDSVFQANDTSGFSIVTYTGTGSAGTIRHGLSVAPSMVIIKNRTGGSVPNWVIGQDQSGFTGQMYFDTGAFSTNSGSFNNTAPTSSVVTINTDSTVNQSTKTYVMYCFANVEGYSKIGKFTGNNLLDGPFIYTGFRPAWIMAKRTDSTSDWFLLDNKRSPQNVVGGGGVGQLPANLNYAESSLSSYAIVDFLSNGFKMRSDMNYGYWNASGGTYIYLAFAKQPLKFSNGR